MGLTASGGLRGPRRAQARRLLYRSSRFRTGLLGLLLAVPIVAGVAVVAFPPVAQAPGSQDVAGSRVEQPAAGVEIPTVSAAPAPAAHLQPLGTPPSPSAAAPRSDGLAYGSVDPADPVPGVTPDPADDDVDRGTAGMSRLPSLFGLPAWIGSGSAAGPAEPAPLPPPPSLDPEELKGYIWPLRGARIHGWFADSEEGFIVLRDKRIHDGLDLATFCGHRVVAAHSGTVLYAGRAFHQYLGFDGPVDAFYERLRAGGDWMSLPRVVVIDDGNGYRSAYVHLGSHSVKPGDVVKAGDPIGKEGATGQASGCHLHYMLIRMDGPWVPVAPKLVRKWDYPANVRERIDPIRVLSFKLKGAARRVPGVTPPKVPFRYVAPQQQPVRPDARL